MKKNSNLKIIFATFLLLNALFISPLNVKPAFGDDNYPPVANDDSAVTDENVLVSIDVLSNDYSFENSTLILDSIIVPPSNGIAAISGDFIDYTPELDWTGVDTFEYQVLDSEGLTDTALVNVVVNAVNNPPIVSNINDQTINVGDDFKLIYLNDYVEDDKDSDENITWSYSGNTELIVTIMDNIATITTPNINWTGEETVTFRATDVGGLFDEDDVIFSVVSVVNVAPVVLDIPDQVVSVGGNFSSFVLDDFVFDLDDDVVDIFWSFSGNVDLDVSVVDRVVSVFVPVVDWVGEETVVFRATDVGGLFDEDSATFKVTTMNNPPTVSDIPDQSITNGSTFATINLDVYVSDIDNMKDEMTWTYSGNTELNVSIVARVAIITILDPNWNGEETITFRATDPDALFDEDNATFNVSSVRDPPNTPSDPDQVIDETNVDFYTESESGGSNNLGGGGAIWTTRDDCGDENQNVNVYCYGDEVYINGENFNPDTELNWTITGLPSSCDPKIIVANGTILSGIDGSFCFPAYTIEIDDCGEYKVNVENKNDNFNVSICNYPPIANDDYVTVIEGGTVTILDSGDDSVLGNDTDPDGDL